MPLVSGNTNQEKVMTTATGTIQIAVTPPRALKRKQLAEAIATKLGLDVTYLGTPSFAYQVAKVRLDKQWTIPLAAESAAELIPIIEAAATECGAIVTLPEGYEATALEPTGVEDVEGLAMTVAMPTAEWTERTRANLEALLASKGPLIAKALGIAATPFEFNDEDETVGFPWFESVSAETARDAVIPLLAGLCQRAEEARRISAKPPRPGNDKYTMRCFLLSLGFIGPEHKQLRRILLANLDGNAAWRTPKDEQAA